MSISAIGTKRFAMPVSADIPRPQRPLAAPQNEAARTEVAKMAPAAGGTPATASDSVRNDNDGGIIGCVGCSLPKTEPMSDDREKELDQAIRNGLEDDPEALKAYENLLQTDLFTRSSWGNGATESRVAILEQVNNYKDAEVIDALSRLGERGWYREQSFDDKQRSAKLIAFNVSDTTPGSNSTRDNTINRILSSDDVDVGWDSISSDPGTITYGNAGSKGFLFWQKDYINLNRDLVPAGPEPIDPKDDDAVHVVVNTLAHEINHTITPGGNEQSYGYFMDEYRAWYVGYEAEHGHPPTAREAYDRASYLTSNTSGSYGNIGKAFQDTGSDDQKNIVAFMAQIMGLDPATATYEDVTDMHNFDNDGAAPAPVSAFPDDPNNLDNG